MTRQTVPDQPKEMKGIWKPTPADSKREGEYLRLEPPRIGKEKFGETYVILDPTGQEISLPNHTVLQGKMKTLKPGEYVWISFIGKDNKTLLYNVEHDPEYKSQTKLDAPRANDEQVGIGRIMASLSFASKAMPDGIIPEAIIKQLIQGAGFTGTAVDEMFKLVKDKGLLAYAGNGLKVV